MADFNQKTGLAFLGLTLVFVIGFLVWMFLLNKGEVVFFAKAPYIVDGSFISHHECAVDRCSFRIAPGYHHFELTKVGYVSQEFDVDVRRGETSQLKVNFSLEPTFEEVETAQIRFPSTKSVIKIDRELRLEALARISEIDLSSYSGIFESVAFKSDGSQAILSNGKKHTLWDVASKKIIFSLELDALSVVSGLKEESLFYLSVQKKAAPQGVYEVNSQGEKQITSFLRHIQKAQLFPQPHRNSLIVVDSSKMEKKIYLLDLDKKSKNLLTTVTVQQIDDVTLNKSGTYLFVRSARLKPYLFVYESSSSTWEKKTGLKINSHGDWLGDELMFVAEADEKVALNDYTELFQARVKRPSAKSQLVLYRYIPSQNSYSRIMELPDSVSSVMKVEASESEHAVYLKDGKAKIYRMSF